MRGVAVAAAHVLLHLHIHIAFAVLLVMEHRAAVAGVAVLQIHMRRLLHQNLPEPALLLVAGKRHAYRGRLPLGKCFDGYVYMHIFIFLSQPSQGCFQKPQPVCRLLSLRLKLRLSDEQVPPHRVAVVIAGEQLADGAKPEAHVLEGVDPPRKKQLLRLIVAVAGFGINPNGPEQADLVVVSQHADADSGKL